MSANQQGAQGEGVGNIYGFLLALLRLSPWLVLVLLILGVAAIIYVFVNYDVSYQDGGLSVLPKMRKVEWRGFYVDIGNQKIFYVTFEDLNLNFYESGEIRGISAGTVQQGPRMIMKEWRVRGYYNGEFIFMSYETTKEEGKRKSPGGVGTYVLNRRGINYSGYVIFRDSKNDVTVQCPYVLSKETNLSADEAKARWPQLTQRCVDVTFPAAP